MNFQMMLMTNKLFLVLLFLLLQSMIISNDEFRLLICKLVCASVSNLIIVLRSKSNLIHLLKTYPKMKWVNCVDWSLIPHIIYAKSQMMTA